MNKPDIEAARAVLRGPIKRIEKMAKKNSIATRRIIALATGKGPAKRIAADARRPRKFSRNDGVRFDPKWQDEVTKEYRRKSADTEQAWQSGRRRRR